MQRRIIPGVIDGSQALCCLPSTATAREAASLMAERHVGAVMIVMHGRLEGIVTERDLVTRLLAGGGDPDTTTLAMIMTPDPHTMSPDDLAVDALDKMRKGHFRHLPVLRGGEVCGMVSIRDLYEAIRASLEEDLHGAETLIFGDQYGTATS